MPDFSICVKDNEGDIWCWDRETQAVVKAILSSPPVQEVPREILYSLIKEMQKAEGADHA